MSQKITNLSRIGNFPESYQHRKHRIVYFGYSFAMADEMPIAGVKLYSMRSLPKEPFTMSDMMHVSHMVGLLLKKEVIKPLLGLGFAIVSDGFLNVSMWGGEYPSLVNPNLFSFGMPLNICRSLKRLDIRESGAYCVWEVGNLSHEGLAWREYSRSARTQKDKIGYLENSFSGILE